MCPFAMLTTCSHLFTYKISKVICFTDLYVFLFSFIIVSLTLFTMIPHISCLLSSLPFYNANYLLSCILLYSCFPSSSPFPFILMAITSRSYIFILFIFSSLTLLHYSLSSLTSFTVFMLSLSLVFLLYTAYNYFSSSHLYLIPLLFILLHCSLPSLTSFTVFKVSLFLVFLNYTDSYWLTVLASLVFIRFSLPFYTISFPHVLSISIFSPFLVFPLYDCLRPRTFTLSFFP